MAAPKRGKMISLRLTLDAETKLQELHEYRLSMLLNRAKCDIISQAIELLHEKELGQWKPKKK